MQVVSETASGGAPQTSRQYASHDRAAKGKDGVRHSIKGTNTMLATIQNIPLNGSEWNDVSIVYIKNAIMIHNDQTCTVHLQFLIMYNHTWREKGERGSARLQRVNAPWTYFLAQFKDTRKQTTLLMEVVIEARSKCWCKSKSLQLLDSLIILDHCIPGLWSVIVACCFHGLFLASLFGTCGIVGFDLSPCYQDPIHMKPSSKHDKSNSIKWNVN